MFLYMGDGKVSTNPGHIPMQVLMQPNKRKIEKSMNANQTHNKILKILIRSFLKLSWDVYDAHFYQREKETHTPLSSSTC